MAENTNKELEEILQAAPDERTRRFLTDLVEKFHGGGGGSGTELFSETVTTVVDEDASYGNFSYSMLIDSDTIVVTFNGTAYTCQKSIDEMGSVVYGATHSFDTGLWDFSEYPFCISSSGEENYLVTETAGTYTVSVSIPD